MTEDANPVPDQRAASRWQRIIRSVDASFSRVGTAIALVAAITSLAFTLVPRLKPAEPHPVGVSVSEIHIQRNVTFWEYLGTRGAYRNVSPDGPGMQQVGIQLEATLDVEGLAGQTISMTAELLDAQTSTWPPPARGDRPTTVVDSIGIGAAPEMKVPISTWIPETNRPGEYFIRARFHLYQPKEEYRDQNGLLAVADTKPFRIKKRDASGHRTSG
jgi:hypothetical protein